MSFIAIDFGTKKMGVAVGQMVTKTASPLPQIKLEKERHWIALDKIIEEWQPEAIIVGIPLNMDGSPMTTTELAQNFVDELRVRFPYYPIETIDERLTTKEARQMAFDMGGYKKISESNIDSLSACIMLEQWMRNKHV